MSICIKCQTSTCEARCSKCKDGGDVRTDDYNNGYQRGLAASKELLDERLHIGDVVQHKRSGMLGKVTGFAKEGTDVMVEDTGPYPQADFDRLVREK